MPRLVCPSVSAGALNPHPDEADDAARAAEVTAALAKHADPAASAPRQ